MTENAQSKHAPRQADPRIGILKGLLWYEWVIHGRSILTFLAMWIACTWVLVVFVHPALVLLFGFIYAYMAAPALCAREVFEGSEEFSFTLPPTRGQRYLVRFSLGVLPLLFFTGVGLLAVRYELPQKLWGLVVDSGFTEPLPPWPRADFYPYAVMIPLTVFTVSFAIAAAARSARLISNAWLLGVLATGGISLLLVIDLHRPAVAGDTYLICLSHLAVSAGAFVLGYVGYVAKVGVNRPALPPVGRQRPWWVQLLVLILLLWLLSILVVLISTAARR